MRSAYEADGDPRNVLCPSKILAVAVSENDARTMRECLGDELRVEPVPLAAAAQRLERDESISVVLFNIEDDTSWIFDLRELLAVRPGSRVILISRLADDRLWAEALEAGAYDLLLKPFDKMEISSVVRSAILQARGAPA
jgi:DNA-binding NtrC family response regulator